MGNSRARAKRATSVLMSEGTVTSAASAGGTGDIPKTGASPSNSSRRPTPKKGVAYTAYPAQFESARAIAVASGMELTVWVTQLFMAFLTGGSVGAYVAISMWHGTLWLLAHLVLLRVKQPNAHFVWKAATIMGVALLLGLPQLDVYQGVPASASAAGAAGVFNGARALQVGRCTS